MSTYSLLTGHANGSRKKPLDCFNIIVVILTADRHSTTILRHVMTLKIIEAFDIVRQKTSTL